MPFYMSDKAKIEEELMEVKSFCDNFTEDLEKVVSDIDECQRLDLANDKVRNDVMSHLLASNRSMNMKDYEDAENHIHAMMQLLTKQEKMDLEDDRPRMEARIKLAVLRERAINKSDRLRKLLKELNAEVKNKVYKSLDNEIRGVDKPE